MTRARRTTWVRSAATFVAALGLCACSQQIQPADPAVAPSPPEATASTGLPGPIPDTPGGPALPASTALVDVMVRLSDPAVPGAGRISLIESGTAAQAAALDRFTAALRDNGSLPLTFEVRDLGWSQSAPGNVIATVVIRSARPGSGEFTYPMEFTQSAGEWQLTRQTADLLLQVDPAAPVPPSAPPAPAAPAPPNPPPGPSPLPPPPNPLPAPPTPPR